MQIHDKIAEDVNNVREAQVLQDTQNKYESPWTVQGAQRIECSICGLTRSSRHQMEKHMKNHEDDEEDCMFTCTEECQYRTMNRDQLIDHLERKHEKYTCNKCNKSCNGKNDLDIHITKEHKSHKPCRNYATDSCDYNSECKFKHIKLKQNEHICYNCGVRTNALKDLMTHIREIHGSQPCTKYAEGKCDRNNRCWYSHRRSQNTKTSQVFQVNQVPNTSRKKFSSLVEMHQVSKEAQYQKITQETQKYLAQIMPDLVKKVLESMNN